MGYYFEQFEVGMRYETPRRTVTDTDVIQFAGISGDFNPLHIDNVYAGQTKFGRRVAHGPLILALVTGLSARTGHFDGTTLAMLGLQWKYLAPVFPDDTIYAEMEITNTRLLSDQKRGIVTRDIRVYNQEGVKVQEGEFVVMVKSRSYDDD